MQLQELRWPAIAAVSKNVPVVVPIAAVEQHAGILPIFTDSMLLEEVVPTVAQRLGDRIVWAPLLWLGNSHHHLDFAGTLSAAPRTYLDLLGDLIYNFVAHGFRRIVLLNGHFVTWTSTAFVQGLIGRWIDRMGSYSAVTCLAGLVPALGMLALLLLWNQRRRSQFDP